MYHTPCGDVMKSHMKLCNERNCNLVSEKIFYSFGVDWPSDAPEPVRTDTSHGAETSDDDTPFKSSKQQPSGDKHSLKVSAGKPQAGGTSSLDHGTLDSEAESPSETLTPVSKTPAGSSKKALLGKSSNKHKHNHHKHKDGKHSHEHKSDHKSKHSSRKKEKKCKYSNSEGGRQVKACKTFTLNVAFWTPSELLTFFLSCIHRTVPFTGELFSSLSLYSGCSATKDSLVHSS